MFNQLPIEILSVIVINLSPTDIQRLFSINKYLGSLITNQKYQDTFKYQLSILGKHNFPKLCLSTNELNNLFNGNKIIYILLYDLNYKFIYNSNNTLIYISQLIYFLFNQRITTLFKLTQLYIYNIINMNKYSEIYNTTYLNDKCYGKIDYNIDKLLTVTVTLSDIHTGKKLDTKFVHNSDESINGILWCLQVFSKHTSDN